MIVVSETKGKEYILHVSSNGMITIPAKVKKELDITAETPLKLRVVGRNELSLKKMRLVEDSVAFQVWREHPLKLSREQIVGKVRKIRRGFYEAGEQFDG